MKTKNKAMSDLTICACTHPKVDHKLVEGDRNGSCLHMISKDLDCPCLGFSPETPEMEAAATSRGERKPLPVSSLQFEKARLGAEAIPNATYREAALAVIAKAEIDHSTPPFKFFVVAGGDWLTFSPKGEETITKAWKDFHGYTLPKKAKIMVVHPSYGITNDGLNYSAKAGAWAPVEVK